MNLSDATKLVNLRSALADARNFVRDAMTYHGSPRLTLGNGDSIEIDKATAVQLATAHVDRLIDAIKDLGVEVDE